MKIDWHRFLKVGLRQLFAGSCFEVLDEFDLSDQVQRLDFTEVISKLLQSTEKEDVYQIDCAGWEVTCVVINDAPETAQNWLWDLLRGDRTRWKSGSISAILNQIATKLRKMGIQDPEIEKFETEVIESWLEEIDLGKTSQGKNLIKFHTEKGMKKGIEKGVKKVAVKMIEAGKSDADIAELTELDLETIKQLRDELAS